MTSHAHIDNMQSDPEVERVKSMAASSNPKQLIIDAKDATSNEHNLSLVQAIKLYRKAIGWSALLSTALIMEGYDLVLMGSFYAVPAFQRKYGHELPDGSFQLTPAWQSGLSNGASVGAIMGLFLNGWVSERFGFKKTMIASLTILVALIFIPFFAQNVQTLLVGQILMGIPLGIFQTLTTTYASEVTPVHLRAYLTTYVNMCWIMGQLIASGVLRGLVSRSDQWAYRIPFAIQWIWPIPLIIGISFAPESPWWLVRKGRYEEAKHSLDRLTYQFDDTTFNSEQTVAMMIHTVELEQEIGIGTTYFDCFKGVNLRRTEIACMVWSIQTLSGSGFRSFSTYFFQQAGLATDQSFSLAIGQYALGIFGVLMSWFLMPVLGRRTIFFYGLALMMMCLTIVGALGCAPESNGGAKWGVAGLALIYVFFYDATIGPVTYSLVSEIPSTNLRSKTVVLARNSYNILNIASNVYTPYMINPTAGNLKAKSGFVWAGICFICLFWIWFRLPEPKGRTFAELDILFENKTPARKFAQTKVDAFVVEKVVEERHEKI